MKSSSGPGTGLHPLRGQNNVQGASDAGLIPMMFPNYQKVVDDEKREWFESFWGSDLDNKPGFTVTEIMDQVFADETDENKIRGHEFYFRLSHLQKLGPLFP